MAINIKSNVQLKGKLSIGAGAGAAPEPDDHTNFLDPALATPITVDGPWVNGAYQVAGNDGSWDNYVWEIDVFKFTAVEGQVYTVEYEILVQGNNPTTSTYVHRASDLSQIANATASIGSVARLLVPAEASGDYLFRSFVPEDSTYRVRVVSGAPADPDDHGTTIGTGTVVPGNGDGSIAGAFNWDNAYYAPEPPIETGAEPFVVTDWYDDDWFRHTFDYATSGYGGSSWMNFSVSGGAVTMEVYGPADQLLASDVTSYQVPASGYISGANNGTYKIKVKVQGGSSYTLSIGENQDTVV